MRGQQGSGVAVPLPVAAQAFRVEQLHVLHLTARLHQSQCVVAPAQSQRQRNRVKRQHALHSRGRRGAGAVAP